MKRLSAFTLLEVLISMLLVVILGTMALFTLTGSMRNLTDLGGISGKQLAVLWFCQQAQADVDAATTATTGPDGALVFEGSNGRVRYEQQGDSLVRVTDDGFRTQLALRAMVLHEVTGAQGLVGLWEVQPNGPMGTGPLVFRKDYDVQTLLRYLIDHGHPGPDLP